MALDLLNNQSANDEDDDFFNDRIASQKLDKQGAILNDAFGIASATVAEAGASIWNSLPFTETVETRDLLRRWDANSLEIYDANQESLEVAGFIAGSFVPGTLMVKGMNLLRAGAKGSSWFSDAYKADKLLELERVAKLGKAGISEEKAIKRALYGRAIGNNIADTIAVEAGIVTMLGASPMMEDYWKDPVTNIGLSLAFGGVIGGAAAGIATRFDINKIKGSILRESYDEVAEEITTSPTIAPAVAQLKVSQANVDSLDEIITRYKDVPEQQLTVEVAKHVRLQEAAKQTEFFRSSFADDDLLKLPQVEQDAIMNRFIKQTGSEQIDSIRLLKFNEEDLSKASAGAGSNKSGVLKSALEKVPFKPVLAKGGNTIEDGIEAIPDLVYLPEFNAYVDKGKAINFSRAGSISNNIDDLAKRMEPQFGKVPNSSRPLLYASDNAASIDAAFLGAMRKAADFTQKDIYNLNIDLDDLATTNALVALSSKNPELFAGTTIKVSSSVKGESKFMNIQEIADRVLRQKEELINSQVKKGIALETIAIRTNTPLTTVQALATLPSRNRRFENLWQRDENLQPSTYSSIDEVLEGNYLKGSDLPLIVKANKNKFEWAERLANLDKNSLDYAAKEFMSVKLATSQSVTARELGSFMRDKEELFQLIRQEIGNANNSTLGNAFLTSADQFLRNTGAFGMAATTIGKSMSDMARNAAVRITNPVSQTFESIVKEGPEAVIEFNTAMAVNSGLQGVRRYENRQFLQQVLRKDYDGNEIEEWIPAEFRPGEVFTVTSDSVDKALTSMAEQGRELLYLGNTRQSIQGGRATRDLGFWAPAFNPKGKYVAYVWDSENNRTSLLLGRNQEELNDSVQAYKQSIPAHLQGKIQVVEDKTEQELYNILKGREDVLEMTIADVNQFKTGSTTPAIVRSDTQVMQELIGGYEHYVESNVRRLGGMMMYDTMDMLKKISTMNMSGYKNQNLGAVKSFLEQPKDAANSLKNILLGNSNLSSYEWWDQANNIFEATSTYGLGIIRDAFKPVLDSIGSTVTNLAGKAGFNKSENQMLAKLKDMDYEEISKKLADKGMINPWAAFDEAASEKFRLSNLADHSASSRRLIFGSNAFAGTFALRFLEAAQPIVNALSLPILTSLAVYDRMPSTFLGVQKATGKASPIQAMYEGIRAMNSPSFASLNKKWDELGYTKGYVSEANDFMRQSRQFESGLTSKLEDALDSNMVRILSTPADVTEDIVRKVTLNTGAALAKRLYPGLSDEGVTIFARNFMDRAVGNYHAPQRPTAFQGTMGVAMGLFQTYVVTMGQSIYRKLELRDYKSLSKAALLQSGMFGASSLPGFDIVSTQIGNHFSDDNIDLTTGTYRAFGDPIADKIIYGLPSSLGPSLYSRGDLQPRVPAIGSPLGMAGMDFLGQASVAGWNVVKALAPSNPEKAQALGEALSMQSVSRPIARVSELFSGYSVTRQGNTVATPNEVGSIPEFLRTGDTDNLVASSILARVLSTRPLQEAKIREAMYANTLYGSLDFEARQKAMANLKMHIRSGDLNQEILEKTAEEYMRTGTPEGWRAAINEAIIKSNTNGKDHLLQLLKPDNPLNFMIDSLDGY